MMLLDFEFLTVNSNTLLELHLRKHSFDRLLIKTLTQAWKNTLKFCVFWITTKFDEYWFWRFVVMEMNKEENCKGLWWPIDKTVANRELKAKLTVTQIPLMKVRCLGLGGEMKKGERRKHQSLAKKSRIQL